MKRIALIAGAAGLAAVLFFMLRGGKTSTEPQPPSPEPRRAAMVAAPRPLAPVADPAVAKVDDVPHANTVNLPETLEPGYLAVERAAKDCYRGHAPPTPIRPNGPDETIDAIQLSYRQVSSHGVGRVEALKVLHGKLTDEALQTCIVTNASAVAWSSTAPDGVIGELEQNLTVGDLMRPDPGLPPESQRSPKPTAPPPPGMAAPLGTPTPEVEDDHPDVIVAEPGLAKRPK